MKTPCAAHSFSFNSLLNLLQLIQKERRKPVLQCDAAVLIFFFLCLRDGRLVLKLALCNRVAHRVARSSKGAAWNFESSSRHDTCNSCLSVSLCFVFVTIVVTGCLSGKRLGES